MPAQQQIREVFSRIPTPWPPEGVGSFTPVTCMCPIFTAADNISLCHMHPSEDLLAAEALAQLRGDRCIINKVTDPLVDTIREKLPTWTPFQGTPSPVPVQVRTPETATVPGTPDTFVAPHTTTQASSGSDVQSITTGTGLTSRSTTPGDTSVSEPVLASPAAQPPLWKNMLMTATAMVIQPETQRKLRYFLQMLKLANDHLGQKLLALRESMDAESRNTEPKISASAIRQDIVVTVRKSMTVISTFAADSLPERARFAVRSCVLSLPSRWASTMENASQSEASESAVLSLATESLTMIQNVTNIVDQTLTKADIWCQKLGKRRREEDDAEDHETIRRELGIPSLAPTRSTDSEVSFGVPASPVPPAETRSFSPKAKRET